MDLPQGSEKKSPGENDKKEDCQQGDSIQNPSVGVLPHDFSIVRQNEHEEENKGEKQTVDDLGVEHNGNQGQVGEKNDSGPEKNHQGIEAIKLWSFMKLSIQAGFPPEGFADGVRGGKRKDRSCKKGSIEEPKGEQPRAIGSSQRSKRQGGIFGRFDSNPRLKDGDGAEQHDKKGYDIDNDRAEDHIHPGILIILRL